MIDLQPHQKETLFSRRLCGFTEIIHGVSTRKLGNMHHKFGDAATSERNRRAFLEKLGLSTAGIVIPEIVHGTQVAVVGKDQLGKIMKGVDGLVTNTPGVFISTFGADCVPILAYDPTKRVVGSAHAGWMGTLGLISQKLILTMKERFGTKPRDVLIYLGPSIGPCHYDQASDMEDGPRGEKFVLFLRTFPDSVSFNGEVAYIDLWSAHKKQLVDVGVREENIEVSGFCTVCHNDAFYSNHVEGRNLGGAIMALIGLRTDNGRIAQSS